MLLMVLGTVLGMMLGIALGIALAKKSNVEASTTTTAATTNLWWYVLGASEALYKAGYEIRPVVRDGDWLVPIPLDQFANGVLPECVMVYDRGERVAIISDGIYPEKGG